MHMTGGSSDVQQVSENYEWHESTGEFKDLRTHDRAEDSSYTARIDVYEDRVRGWFLDIALQQTKDGPAVGDYVALSIAAAHLEGVEQFRRGRGGGPGAGERFQASAARVFSDVEPTVLETLWESVRSGLFHTGFTEGAVKLSDQFESPLVESGGYLQINPASFVRAVVEDFSKYVQELRDCPEGDLARSFVQLWEARWKKW